MAPIKQAGDSSMERDRKKPGERRSELVCRVNYCNTLPDIPFDPKSISYRFEPNRFVSYKTTSLEHNYKYELLTNPDLGVKIDLIDPKTYEIDPNAVLHPDDEKLLEEDTPAPQDSKRSRHHNLVVPWLRKTEYIATEFSLYGRTGVNTETKVGYNVRRLFKEEDLYMDRESQIKAINKTFEEAQKPIEGHYSKPNIKAVEVLPLFPDSTLWAYPFAQVMFDSDPAPITQLEEMSRAMIRGVTDESGEQFVAYFLPTEDTIKKQKKDAEEGKDYMDHDDKSAASTYEYRIAREYNWNLKNKASKGYEENFFFVFRDDGVYYNELETRVRLTKRRLKPGVQPNNSMLVVRHRPLNEMEHKIQQARLKQLEQLQEEEEEEEAAKEKKEAESKVEEMSKEESKAELDNGKQGPARSNKGLASSSSSASGSSSSEEDEVEKKCRDEEEIFGSGSDSD